MKNSKIVIIVGFGLVIVLGVLAMTMSDSFYQAIASQSTSSLTNQRQAPSEPAGCDEVPMNAPSAARRDLDNDAKDWGVYCEGSPTWIKESVTMPSIDGKALHCSITGGAPYSNVHCYRNLLPEPNASEFTLTMSFKFSSTTCNNQASPSVIQALEFTMNKWYNSKRYEFALQWQNVPQAASDSTPQWRYWDPQRWVSFNPPIKQCLEGEKWHTLILKGNILNDQVHYIEFTIDQITHRLDITVPPYPDTGESRLAVAIQLDGNFMESPYDVYIDSVQLDVITSISDKSPNSYPSQFELMQNNPNPFNPSTTIQYILVKPTNVQLTIYNSLGQVIRTLVNEKQLQGLKSVVWNGENDFGEPVSSGIYFYNLRVGEQAQTNKMLLIKQ